MASRPEIIHNTKPRKIALVTGYSTLDPDVVANSPYDWAAPKLMEPTGVFAENMDLSWTTDNPVKAGPRIYLNRIVGSATVAPFTAITDGIDLDNAAGALSDFYAIWTRAIEVAIERGTCVFFDPEFYNLPDAACWQIDTLVSTCGQETAIVTAKVQAIGAALADICASFNQSVTIWSLYTNMNLTGASAANSTHRHLFYGFLERCKAQSYSDVTLIDGGEAGFGYCRMSLSNTFYAVRSWWLANAAHLDNYPSFRLGATIVPWHDVELKTGVWATGGCGSSTLLTLTDFVPVLRYLFQMFRYVWIYAASGVGYNPNDPPIADLYNAAILEALYGIQS